MPTYEYHCTACEHITDFFCGFSDRPNSILCEQCEAEAEYRISTGSKPIVKGSSSGETIGDLFDRAGLEIGGAKNKDANKQRLENMRKKKND